MSENMDLEYAQGWKPEVGDKIIGRVLAVDLGWSDFRKGQYPIITIRPDDGGDPVAVHCFHTALYNRMLTLQPRAGQRIGIQYQGKRPHKSNPSQEVAVYAARVEGGGADVWSTLNNGQVQRVVPAPVPVDAEDFAPPQEALDDDIPF